MPERVSSCYWDNHQDQHTWVLWCDEECVDEIKALDCVVSIRSVILVPVGRWIVMLNPRYHTPDAMGAVQAITDAHAGIPPTTDRKGE